MIIASSFTGKLMLLGLLLASQLLKGQTSQAPVKGPKALRPDIRVEHVMAVAPKSVRILYDPLTGNAFFTCYDGEVYQINNFLQKNPTAVKILTVEDHGIPRLQGS